MVRDQWNAQPQLGRGRQAGLAGWVFMLCDVCIGGSGLGEHHTQTLPELRLPVFVDTASVAPEATQAITVCVSVSRLVL